VTTETMETLEAFRGRARDWLAANMPLRERDLDWGHIENEEDAWQRARELQHKLHEGGFAGVSYPRAYGGQGLTAEHQKVFTEESMAYDMPLLLNVPTFSICAPTIMDFGTEEQKRRYLPALLRGDEVWVQFLSEPRGGSDLAGCTTRATRDGDVYVLNGSKTWSSGAYAADYALCLARTNWDVPKHSGLTMLIVKVHQPGIDIRRIKQVNGASEFCEEFFDDVLVPAEDVLGEENQGWAVASRQLYHERTAVGGGSPYTSGRRMGGETAGIDLVAVARATGQVDDAHVRELVAEAHVLDQVQEQLIARVSDAIRTGQLPQTAASLLRLFSATTNESKHDIALEIAGAAAVTTPLVGVNTAQAGLDYLMRQGGSLGGGSSEMSRNLISERFLDMPREPAADRDIPFNQVKQGTAGVRR